VTAPEEWLTELANATSRELTERANAALLGRINERDHLQPSCSSVARAIAKHWVPQSAVSTSFRFRSPLWPRLGSVDIALLSGDQPSIGIELKCGGGRDALGPCAWDALKLALGVQSRVLSAGYLLAATTAADWERGHRGSELPARGLTQFHDARCLLCPVRPRGRPLGAADRSHHGDRQRARRVARDTGLVQPVGGRAPG